ncbi:hypothetical protein D3C78_1436550 [compost metagenome]
MQIGVNPIPGIRVIVIDVEPALTIGIMPSIVVTCPAEWLNCISLARTLIISEGNIGLLIRGNFNKRKVSYISPGLQRKLGLGLLLCGKGAKAGILIIGAKSEV